MLGDETRLLGWATIFLSVVVAISTAVQAFVIYDERQTPFRTALHEKQLTALMTISDLGGEECRARLCFSQAGPRRDECLKEPLSNSRNLRKAIEDYILVSGSEQAAAVVRYSALNGSILLIEKHDSGIEARTFSDAFEKQKAYATQCREALTQFIASARQALGLPRLSDDLRKQFLDSLRGQ